MLKYLKEKETLIFSVVLIKSKTMITFDVKIMLVQQL